MKKVIYIVKSELHIYPPCIAQIRILKKCGVDVEVWYGSCDKQLLTIFDSENVPYVDLREQRGKLPGKLDKLNNWQQFAFSVKKRMKNLRDVSKILFWFGTAETAMPMIGMLKGYNYALTSLELLDDNKFKNKLFCKLTGDAKFIVCCETSRAYIMRNWYGLKKLPYVMPNKPYDFHDERRKTPSIEATQKAIELVQDKKFIIYQGILKSLDYMLEMVRAIRDSGTGYYFVLMGLDPENIFEDIQKEYERCIFIKNIPAPYHLEVTSYASIGFVFYDDRNSLNRAFCAPNKIYEYSGLHIPAIGNEVPGLINTIGAAKAGVCVPMKRGDLIHAIRDIEEHYDLYAQNAYDFYQGTDNVALMKQIIVENGIQ